MSEAGLSVCTIVHVFNVFGGLTRLVRSGIISDKHSIHLVVQ